MLSHLAVSNNIFLLQIDTGIFFDMFFLNFVDVSDLLDSSRCHLAATDPMAYHPTSSIQAHLRSQRQLLSEYATSFRAQEEVQGRRRDAAEVGIFSLGKSGCYKGEDVGRNYTILSWSIFY